MDIKLGRAPSDSADRLIWLSEQEQEVKRQFEDLYADTYSTLRMEGRLDWAISVGLHGRKRILTWTRRWNRKRGRMMKWGDGLDKSSTNYRGY